MLSFFLKTFKFYNCFDRRDNIYMILWKETKILQIFVLKFFLLKILKFCCCASIGVAKNMMLWKQTPTLLLQGLTHPSIGYCEKQSENLQKIILKKLFTASNETPALAIVRNREDFWAKNTFLTKLYNQVFFTAPSTSCVIPINDIRGIGSLVYAKVILVLNSWGWENYILSGISTKV